MRIVPNDLLKELAAKHVMVEINLTSNDAILGVHRKLASVPALSQVLACPSLSQPMTKGVSRIDLTHEYVRAVQNLQSALRRPEKNWRAPASNTAFPARARVCGATPDDFSRMNAACSTDALGAESPTHPIASRFLQSSERARQQWELERRFRTFESSF